MSIYYVGGGGSDVSAGTSWGARFLTLGKAATTVAAGDTVYIGAGTYRELLTIATSGTVGNVISWIGDYLGTNTDGIGGVIRLTGSADDIALTRANCITATSKNYNTVRGILFDGASSNAIALITNCSNWVIDQCYFMPSNASATVISVGGTGTSNTIQNSIFLGNAAGDNIRFTHSSTVDNAGHLVQNCIFLAGTSGVNFSRVGGCTVKNSLMYRGGNGVSILTALTAAQTETVNNCLFVANAGAALAATVSGEITEDYNNFIACVTNRTNVATGTNSTAKLPIFDARWVFQLMFAGAGSNSMRQMLSPFDLSAGSPLVNVAGTSPSTTDLRGTAIQGAQREWGALEYDSTLKIFGGVKKGRSQIGF